MTEHPLPADAALPQVLERLGAALGISPAHLAAIAGEINQRWLLIPRHQLEGLTGEYVLHRTQFEDPAILEWTAVTLVKALTVEAAGDGVLVIERPTFELADNPHHGPNDVPVTVRAVGRRLPDADPIDPDVDP